nr:hypothetical protein [Shewanella sp. VB17]
MPDKVGAVAAFVGDGFVDAAAVHIVAVTAVAATGFAYLDEPMLNPLS